MNFLFSPFGRLGRLNYLIILGIGYALVGASLGIVGDFRRPSGAPALVAAIVLLFLGMAVLWSGMARRLHDADRTALHVLWFLLFTPTTPFVAPFLLLLPGTPGPNRFDNEYRKTAK